MPNWITTKIRTSPEVIKAITNKDDGRIDFELVISFPGSFPWEGISISANIMAKSVVGMLERKSLSDLPDDDFEQFIQMLRNYRKCGFLHDMDFALATWGTKWNAGYSSVSEDQTEASFETAWSCPKPALHVLSQRFPDTEIFVTYADEDLGSNCGTYTLRAGEVVQSDIAPAWREMTEEEQQRWTSFAREVKGWAADEENE